jgi:hypothetical protein
MYGYAREWTELGQIGSFTLHITDIVFVFTLVYCFYNRLWGWRHSWLETSNILLCALLVFNLLRGMAAGEVGAAGVQFRDFSGYIAASVFVYLSYRQLDRDWVFDKVVLLGWGLVLLSIARLIFGLGAFIAAPALSLEREWRTLDSVAALMLGEAALVALSRALAVPRGPGRRRSGLAFIIFSATLLVSDQRTAILGTLAGIGAILILLAPRKRWIAGVCVGSATLFVAIVVCILWLANAGDMTPYLPHDYWMLQSEQSTFAWRQKQWQYYIEMYLSGSPIELLIGLPLGAIRALAFRNDLLMLKFSVHSEYIQLLVNTGVIGFFLFISTLVGAVGRGFVFLVRQAGRDRLRSEIGLAVAIVVSLGVYSYGYMVPPEQGLLFAMALQVIATVPIAANRRQIAPLSLRSDERNRPPWTLQPTVSSGANPRRGRASP